MHLEEASGSPPRGGGAAARPLASEELLARLDRVMVEPEWLPDHLGAQPAQPGRMRADRATVDVHAAVGGEQAKDVRVRAHGRRGAGADDALYVVVGELLALGAAV